LPFVAAEMEGVAFGEFGGVVLDGLVDFLCFHRIKRGDVAVQEDALISESDELFLNLSYLDDLRHKGGFAAD